MIHSLLNQARRYKLQLLGGGAAAAGLLALLWPKKAEAPMVGHLNAFGGIIPCGVLVHADDPFTPEGTRAQVTQIVIHESVTHDPDVLERPGEKDDDATERVLDRRGLGVHIMVGFDTQTGAAQVVQHNDLSVVLHHTGRPVNDLSVGIEVINPYYAPRAPWGQVINAPWAHKGRYVLPTHAQCEAVYLLCEALWHASAHHTPGLAIPRQVWGEQGGRYQMGPVKLDKSTPGLLAHHHYGGHADGAWPTLYVTLRLRGLEPARAYREAVGLATGARGSVALPGGRG